MKRVFGLGLMLMVVVSLSALAQEKILKWNLGTSPVTIDPSYVTSTASQQICHALFLGLTEIDDETLKIMPRLATSWEVSDDGFDWTFHLGRNAMWSDGTPVTAHDLVFAIERTLDPEGGSPLARTLYILKGAEAYNTGSGRGSDIGVRAIDNHTVRFTLIKPDDCFPALVSDPAFYPQPRSIVEDYGRDWIKPEHIVTDGPYTLGQWVNDRMVLYKSATYYNADSVNIDEVCCYMITDPSTALAMYKQGDLDVLFISQEQADSIKADLILQSELHTSPLEASGINSDCLSALTYPDAQLTKPHIVRTYGLLGREKWENWDIQR